jgi:hypothetical protein
MIRWSLSMVGVEYLNDTTNDGCWQIRQLSRPKADENGGNELFEFDSSEPFRTTQRTFMCYPTVHRDDEKADDLTCLRTQTLNFLQFGFLE